MKKIDARKNFGFDKFIKKISNQKISVFNSNCKWFDIGSIISKSSSGSNFSYR